MELNLKPYFHKVLIILGGLIILIGLVIMSREYLGKNNQVEKTIDDTASRMIEIELHLPAESVHVDLGKVYEYADNS